MEICVWYLLGFFIGDGMYKCYLGWLSNDCYFFFIMNNIRLLVFFFVWCFFKFGILMSKMINFLKFWFLMMN